MTIFLKVGSFSNSLSLLISSINSSFFSSDFLNKRLFSFFTFFLVYTFLIKSFLFSYFLSNLTIGVTTLFFSSLLFTSFFAGVVIGFIILFTFAFSGPNFFIGVVIDATTFFLSVLLFSYFTTFFPIADDILFLLCSFLFSVWLKLGFFSTLIGEKITFFFVISFLKVKLFSFGFTSFVTWSFLMSFGIIFRLLLL